MSNVTSFRSLIELWPSRDGMASDIGARASAVSKWWQRDNIPAEWWTAILATERSGITLEVLAELAARTRPAKVEEQAEATQ